MTNNKRIALTIDDLPFVSRYITQKQEGGTEIVDMLLRHLLQNDVRVTGFVIGKNADEKLLGKWHSGGHLLANHTYSHLQLSNISSDEFEKDVIKNEKILAQFLENNTEKYFRFPYLDAGKTAEQRNAALDFLYQRSYTIAPVTLDSKDYIYNEYFTEAWQNDDVKTMQYAVNEYWEYTKMVIEFRERQAIHFYGKPVGLIMLIHANRINSHGLDRMITSIKAMGYEFVSLSGLLNEYDSLKNNAILGQSYFSFDVQSDDGTYKRVNYPKVAPAILEVHNMRRWER